MKTILKIAVPTMTLVAMLVADLPFLPVQNANAVFGTRRRTAVVVGTTVHAADTAAVAASQQQAATAQQANTQQQTINAQQQTINAQQETINAQQKAEAAAEKPLPLGTVVAALPGGCAATPVNGVQYYSCGGNFYRAVFQGNSLVYVTAQPK